MAGYLSAKSADDTYRTYLRELIIASRCGTPGRQRSLARRYDRHLGAGVWQRLEALDDDAVRAAFRDAVEPIRGRTPQTRLGRLLAVPEGVREAVVAGDVWAEFRDFEPGGLRIDPVCEMYVDPTEARYTTEVDGQTIYFCCPHCLRRFLAG